MFAGTQMAHRLGTFTFKLIDNTQAASLFIDSIDAHRSLSLIHISQTGHKVQIIVPQRGDKLRLLKLVKENARAILTNYLNAKDRQEERNAAALEKLRHILGLDVTPARIECYDISHIQGTDMVGSMVVFINGVSSPKHYRHFRIKTLDGSNDFAALQDVLERRWRRGLDERAKGKTPLDFRCV